MPKHLKLVSNLFILAIFMLLISCGNKSHVHQLENYIQELKNSAARSKKTASLNIQIPTAVSYQAENLRSPFETAQGVVGNKSLISSNPLLIYPVSMIKFEGTFFKDNKSVAYILAPDSKLYPVSVGDKIGDHGGKVTLISPDHIEITEPLSSDGKSPTQHVITMQLKEGT